MIKPLKKSQIFNYAILALPLAFVGLPIYVNISDFYAKQFSLNLAIIGFLLLIVRAIDLLQDPFIGYFSDLAAKKNLSHKSLIFISSFLLAICFFLLFNPPQFLGFYGILIWFVTFLVATYTCFNFAVINFESIAVILAQNENQRISLNSTKELFGLIGILLASIAPTILSYFFENDLRKIYFFSSLIFGVLLIFITVFFFRRVEVLKPVKTTKINLREVARDIWKNKIFLRFLIIFLINSIAVSIPAATVIFYVEDVLHAQQNFGIFLAIYFLSGCLFIPFWKNLAQKFNKILIWILSISGSVLTFFFAYFLDAASASYFYLVSFCAGIFLGADLIMPPAIIASLIFHKKEKISSHLALWNMTSKMGLMIASSSSLIILGFFNYQPGSPENSGTEIIPLIYAIVPCFLKSIVIGLLLPLRNYLKFYEN